MYDKDEEPFCHTMHRVIKNIAYFCKRDRGRRKGGVAYIVSVGREKFNPRILCVITAMSVYSEGVANVSERIL